MTKVFDSKEELLSWMKNNPTYGELIKSVENFDESQKMGFDQLNFVASNEIEAIYVQCCYNWVTGTAIHKTYWHLITIR